MIKKAILSACCLVIGHLYGWEATITESELKITPRTTETCYQYAERKVVQMKQKYSDRRIVGSVWLSEYWEHHYEGALNYRNYYWLPQ